jgi:iron complex outermembrane recepter protein
MSLVLNIIAGLLITGLFQSPAQLTITVTDPSGGSIPSAEVVMVRGNEQRTFTTGNDGVAQVSGVATGEWVLTVRRDGFVEKQRPVVIQPVAATLTVSLEIEGLQESILVEGIAPPADLLRLDGLASGGTLLDIPVRDLPASLQVVSQEPVRDLPASLQVVSQELMQERGARSILEATELVAGITTYVDSGAMPGFNSRGFNSSSSSVTLMRDGIKQNTVPQSGRPLDAFLLERVEVLKGPSSILAGEGAIGASINMVTKEPQRRLGGDSLISYGSFGSRRVGLDITGPFTRNLSGRLAAVYTKEPGWVDRSGGTLRSMVGSLRWNPTEAIGFKATAVVSDDSTISYYGTPFIGGVIDPRTRFLNYNMRDNLNKGHNNHGSIDGDFALPAGWQVHNKFFASTQRVDWRNFEGVSYNATTQKVILSGYFLAKRDDVLVGNQLDVRKTFTPFGRTLNFVSGFLYQDNNVHRWSTPSGAPTFSLDPYNPEPVYDPGLEYVRNRDVYTDTTAVFMESLFAITNRLKLVTGLRWDNIKNDRTDYLVATQTGEATFQTTTGRAGLVFTVHPNVNLYVSNSRSVEPTTPFVSIAGSAVNFSLQPSRQWETGLKATLFGNRLDTTVAYFRIGKRNILTQTVVDGVRLQQQIGRQVSDGLEFSFLTRPVRNFTLNGDLALTNAEYKEFNENVGTGVVSRSGNDVAHVAPVVATLSPSISLGPVSYSMTVRTVGARWGEAANTRRLSPYTTLDAALTVRLPQGTTLTLMGRNLTDELYIPRSSNTSGRIAAPRGFEAQLAKKF